MLSFLQRLSLENALEYVVETNGLTKRYGRTVAIDGVDLAVPAQTVFGALGPNGSGKSTTIRMILGLGKPDSGTVRLFGHPLHDHAPDLLRRIGSLVEMPAFVPYLSGRDNLRLIEKYIPAGGGASIERALHRVHLGHAADRKFKTYSLGMKQRLGIASAMLQDPDLIILDEPTNGLDPQGTREVRELIPELASDGGTIIICSHLLHEVEQVCNQVAVFQNGRVIAQGPTRALIGQRADLLVRVACEDLEGAREALQASPWSDRFTLTGTEFHIPGAASEGREVNRNLASCGIFAEAIQTVEPTLEDVFFELTGRESHDV